MKEGSWPQDCIQRAFVEGAQWWQFHHNGSTIFGSERDEAELEAVKRYGETIYISENALKVLEWLATDPPLPPPYQLKIIHKHFDNNAQERKLNENGE